MANAERALTHQSPTPALVYHAALATCVRKVDAWATLSGHVTVQRAARGQKKLTQAKGFRWETIGLALLRPGIDELLQLVCRGLETETRCVICLLPSQSPSAGTRAPRTCCWTRSTGP